VRSVAYVCWFGVAGLQKACVFEVNVHVVYPCSESWLSRRLIAVSALDRRALSTMGSTPAYDMALAATVLPTGGTAMPRPEFCYFVIHAVTWTRCMDSRRAGAVT
jgi:hypothetical protein